MRPRNSRVIPGGRQQGFGLGGVSGMRYTSLYPVYCSPPKPPRSSSRKRKRRTLSSHCTRRGPRLSEPFNQVGKRSESESESEDDNNDDDDDDDDGNDNDDDNTKYLHLRSQTQYLGTIEQFIYFIIILLIPKVRSSCRMVSTIHNYIIESIGIICDSLLTIHCTQVSKCHTSTT